VRRRYRRGIASFLSAYRALADFWLVFDNSGAWPREFAFARGGAETILDAETFRLFTQAGGEP
jgi:predicted ABC-type ATPase